MEISWNFFFQRKNLNVNVIRKYWRASRCRSFTKNVSGQLSEKICFLAGSNPHAIGAVEASNSRTTYAEDCHLTGNEILGLLEGWKQFLEVTGQPQSCWVSCSTPFQTSMAWKWQSCCPGYWPTWKKWSGGWVKDIVPNAIPLPLQEVQLTFHALFHSKSLYAVRVLRFLIKVFW